MKKETTRLALTLKTAFGSDTPAPGFCLVKVVVVFGAYLLVSFPCDLVFRLPSELTKIHMKSGLTVTSSVKMG